MKQTKTDHNAKFEILRSVFGFDEFRPHQESVVDAILAGRDAFAVMPTGGGKSLCFQLPAIIKKGVCVVVSPLIALMKDQVDAATQNGIKAACVNSSSTPFERQLALDALSKGELDLLYVAPERLAAGFLDYLKSAEIAFFAVDEAHCISEWGHDFRPDYLVLSKLKELFPETPVAAFTASATEKVRRDIVGRLGLSDPLIVNASFDRPNLFYSVDRKTKAEDQILDVVRSMPNESGIVYRGTRAKVDDTAAFLKLNGIQALPYHAGMDSEERRANQEAFNKDEIKVIVATIAFGMGIDKSNVRYIIHGEIPKNIESYYQETGRAGRDGLPSRCLLLYSPADELLQKHFISQVEDDEERKRRTAQLNEMTRLATSAKCRRHSILSYFGENYPNGNCDACDVCSGEMEAFDATRDAQIIMSAILRTGERFGINHIIDVVRGSKNQRVLQFGHDKIKTHGVGAHMSKTEAANIADQLLAAGALERTPEEHDGIRLTPKGQEILFGKRNFIAMRKAATKPMTPKHARGAAGQEEPFDATLFDLLRALRKRLADERDVPPYVVFSDKSLRDMCRIFPDSKEKMMCVSGVGDRKFKEYGTIFMDAVSDYLAAHPEIEPPAITLKAAKRSSGTKRKNKRRHLETAKFAENAANLADVAELLGISVDTVVRHIEKALDDGEDIRFEHLIDVPEREEVVAFFKKHGTERLAPAHQHFEEKIPYPQLKLIRLTI